MTIVDIGAQATFHSVNGARSKAMTVMAHKLGMNVIAEGIETADGFERFLRWGGLAPQPLS